MDVANLDDWRAAVEFGDGIDCGYYGLIALGCEPLVLVGQFTVNTVNIRTAEFVFELSFGLSLGESSVGAPIIQSLGAFAWIGVC